MDIRSARILRSLAVISPLVAAGSVATEAHAIELVTHDSNTGTMTVTLSDGGDETFIDDIGPNIVVEDSTGAVVYSAPAAQLSFVVVYGGNGDDFIGNSTDLALEAWGYDGDDVIINSGSGDVEFYGGNNDDLLVGDEGDDYIEGGEGNDQIYGADGNDQLYGGAGNDEIRGEQNDDFIDGGPDIDDVSGGGGDDTVINGEIGSFCDLYDDQTITLFSNHGRFVSAGGAAAGYAFTQVVSDGTDEQFVVECQSENTIAVRTSHDLYVQALGSSGSASLGQTATIGTTEIWTPQLQDDGRWAFRSVYDLHIRARPSNANYLVDQYGGAVGAWKHFEVTRQ